MTNENLAVVSAIKSFKLEKEIFKTVIKKLIDKDADDNMIAILLNPDLVVSIIDENKYTDALEYVMHAYQQERRDIVAEMQLKRYEKKVQGAIEEAKIVSMPTMEAATRAGGAKTEEEAKNAKDSAIIFIEDKKEDKLGTKEAEIKAEKTDSIGSPNIANAVAKKGTEEITASLDPAYEGVKKAQDDFAKKNGMDAPKAEVKVPNVTVVPTPVKKEEAKVEAKPEPKKEEPKVESKPEEKKEEPKKLDGDAHEVKSTRETTSFFKKHKKAILIATGIVTIAVTTAAFPTLIVPSIMSANSTLYGYVGAPAVKTVLHGLNTVLGKAIGATYAANGVWYAASGAAINSAAASTCLSSAIATYGLWGVYGKGVVDAIKGAFRGIDMESPKKEDKPKEEKPSKEPVRTNALFESIGAKVETKEPVKEEKKPEVKPEPKKEEAKVESKPVEKVEPKDEVAPFAKDGKPVEEIKPVVEKPVPVTRTSASEQQNDAVVADILREFKKLKETREREEQLAKENNGGGMKL